jgi:hypothetical protein
MRRYVSIGAAVGVAAVVITAGVLTFGGVALADEPDRQTVTLHRDIPNFVHCPYGPLNASFDLTRDISTYTNDGVPVRRIVHGYGSGSITNPGTGQSLDAFVNRVFELDLTNGAAGFSVGYNTRVSLPTGGTAMLGAGMLVFDSTGAIVDEHGPDLPTETAQLCDALAP